MNVEISYEQFVEACLNSEDATPRFGYSGRGMDGRGCPGVVGRSDVGVRVALELARTVTSEQDLEADDALDVVDDLLASVRSDSMGKSTIFYWPRLELTGERPSKEELERTFG